MVDPDRFDPLHIGFVMEVPSIVTNRSMSSITPWSSTDFQSESSNEDKAWKINRTDHKMSADAYLGQEDGGGGTDPKTRGRGIGLESRNRPDGYRRGTLASTQGVLLGDVVWPK
jgi:hypothetical protein